jgi:TRAP-type C4-dicarboxylate transport system permease small subunit
MALNFRESFEQKLTKVAGGLNIIAAACLASIAIIIIYDVLVRELGIPLGVFDEPFYGTNEIVSNSVVAILFLQLPLSILNKSSLRTTILYSLTGTRGKGNIDAISYLLGAVFFILVAYGSYEMMIEGWAIRETEGSGIISIPVYPIRTLLFAVSGVVAGVCVLHAFDAIMRRGKTEDHLEPAP